MTLQWLKKIRRYFAGIYRQNIPRRLFDWNESLLVFRIKI